MKNWKKAGLTALAGSLVAFSANAGELAVSGSATLTYTGNSGAQDGNGAATQDGLDGQRWGMGRGITFTGSGEMDNGWTVTLSQTLTAGAVSGNSIAIDMGDAGTIHYENSTSARGIGKIDDVMPTAHEEVWDGIDVNGTTSGGGITGKVSGGGDGFNYSNSMGDGMATINLGYAPKGQNGASAGAVTGAGANNSSTSATIELTPMDGLSVGAGWGEVGSTTSTGFNNDHSTYYAKYAWGPVTVGYQVSEIDMYNTTADYDRDSWGISYQVNDDLAISYGDSKTDLGGNATDSEIDGMSISYTMGSMSFTAHANEGTGIGHAASMKSEHTEISVSFAF